MKKIVLIGGGGHCISVLDCILSSKEFDDIVIVDSKLTPNCKILDCTVVGDDRLLPDLKKAGFEYAFITVGSIKTTKIRRTLYALVHALGFEFPIICDPSARVSNCSNIGEGSFIGKNAVVNAKVAVGKHCIVNTGAIVEHASSIGDFSHISIGSLLCANCTVGSDTFVGAGSTIIQGINIGKNVIIGAGSVVLGNVDDDRIVSGLVKKENRT